jgi:hypothetical protein
VKVPKSAAQVVQKALADRDAKITSLTADASAQQARFDGLTEKLTAAEAQVKDLPTKIRGEIAARVDLEGRARKVLGADVKLDGKTDRELREMVIAALKPKAELAGKDDAYIQARFDSALEEYTPPTASDRIGAALFTPPTGAPPAASQQRHDAADPLDPATAHAKMRERNQNAWQQKSS